ncbi:hypothetical protein [Pantoea rwandensis]|uniref:Uncharacterized protein n=1 Tax=Pantoea rwandensis TaxID=1076550 RepID=A0ABM5RH50_9GAMM|nr:hypothetical protein [Pantoea rwandensis]AIR85239.1 hypothetical protein LH22_07060 [Pantoea rwandensis]
MSFRTMLPKIGFIVAILSGLATFGGFVRDLNKPSPNLNVEIDENAFNIPTQYFEKTVKFYNSINYDKIHDLIDEIVITGTPLEKDRLTQKVIGLMSSQFSPPFEKSIFEYKKQYFIDITNTGGVVAKDVYVDYPEKVLLSTKDDNDNYSNEDSLVSSLKIPSIRQGGKYLIWVWTKNDKFDVNDIKIGTTDQVANISLGQTYYGKTGQIISAIQDNIVLFFGLLALLVVLFVYSLSIVLSQLIDSK